MKVSFHRKKCGFLFLFFLPLYFVFADAALARDLNLVFGQETAATLKMRYEASVQFPDKKKEALIALAKLELINSNLDAAIADLQVAASLPPQAADELVLLGNAYCKKTASVNVMTAYGLAKKCLDNFEHAVKLEATNTEALSHLADYYLQVPGIAGGSTEKGEKIMSVLLEQYPEQGNLLRVKYLIKQHKTSEAIALATSMAKTPIQSPINQYWLARFFRDNQLYDKAAPLFESVVSSPINLDNGWYLVDGLLQLAEVKLLSHRDLPEAINLIERYKKINNNPSDENYFWSSWSLAKLYKETGNTEKYLAQVNAIKAEDYSRNTAFAKEFDAATKE